MCKVMCFLRNYGVCIFIGAIVCLIILTIIANTYCCSKKEKSDPQINRAELCHKNCLKEKEYICCNESISVIPDECFKDCETLKRIDFKGDISYLGGKAFCGCKNLEEINFFGKLDYYNEKTFSKLNNLKRIYFNELKNVYGKTFFNLSNLESVTISNGLQEIGDEAFANCTNLKMLRLPIPFPIIKHNALKSSSNLSIIYGEDYSVQCGKILFWSNDSIHTIVIPKSITALSTWMFACCNNLNTVIIHDDVAKIETHCFSACSNLKEIQYDGDFERFKEIYPTFYLELPRECLLKTTSFLDGKKIKDLKQK